MQYDKYISLQAKHSGLSNTAWGRQMEDAIINWFAPQISDKNSIILDIGCGEGRGVQALNRLGFPNVTGIDLTEEKVVKGRAKGLNLMLGDMHFLPTFFPKSVDYVFSSHTLEHAMDLELAFKTLATITRKKIFFIVPVGETPALVARINPGHTSCLKDRAQIEDILDRLGLTYVMEERRRLCEEVWGKVLCDRSMLIC